MNTKDITVQRQVFDEALKIVSNHGEYRADLLVDELSTRFTICSQKELERDLVSAKTILIIGDNAGETVFDRMLSELLGRGIMNRCPIVPDPSILP